MILFCMVNVCANKTKCPITIPENDNEMGDEDVVGYAK